MNEKRQSDRELTVGVTTLAHRANGAKLEGVVRDVSRGGIKISGDITGLGVGEEIDIVVVVNGQPVRYACEVRHVDPSKHVFGVLFKSGPTAVAPPQKVRRCMRCSRDFASDCNYCSHCGQKLVTVTA